MQWREKGCTRLELLIGLCPEFGTQLEILDRDSSQRVTGSGCDHAGVHYRRMQPANSLEGARPSLQVPDHRDRAAALYIAIGYGASLSLDWKARKLL
jgi:hypothetical protein